MPKKISDLTINNTPSASDVIPYSNGVDATDRGLNVSYFDDKIQAVDDKASLLAGQIEAAAKGYKPFETKADMDAFTPGDGGDDREIAQVMNDPTIGNNGIYWWDGTDWIKRDSFAEVKQVQDWALSESYTVTGGVSYDDDGIIEAANILWPDGEVGSISDAETDDFGISSIRFNRPDDKYITIAITRDSDGNVASTSSTTNGF